MKLLCLGDSLTFGSAGYSYIRFLDPRISAVNKGKNGDSTRGAAKRLERYLRDPRYFGISTYVVFIGINDILGPFLSTLSPLWKLVMKPRCACKRCITEDSVFAAEYEKILDLLAEHGKKTVLVGLPFIQVKGFPTEKILARNAIIEGLAKKRGLPYADAFSLQQGALKNPGEAYSWGICWGKRVLDIAVMALFPGRKDALSRARRLSLTVDGVHFNSLSAKLLAGEISQKVLLPAEDAPARPGR